MIKQCICKTCGRSFLGGPRAWYCQDCRTERKKEANKKHKTKKKLGATRLLGSVDKCIYCKKEYIVEGGNQVMCPDCKPDQYAEHDRQTSIDFYRENKDSINPERNTRRRIKRSQSRTKNCAWCGKEFESINGAKTCSAECKRLRINKRWVDNNRKKR